MEIRNKLELKNISKIFLNKDSYETAIKKIDLTVNENEFLVLLGPGQCGKTVLLNIIAGLEEQTTGEVYIDGNLSTGFNKEIGFVFQKIGLMPWLRVRDNVAISLKFQGMKKAERYAIAQKYIDLVGLTGFERHFPRQLSGGMKQRVGLARAYAANAEIFLMDEPFGQLDAQTRYSMQDEILRIWEKDRRTVVFVTNNIEEAIYLGDRIILFTEAPMQVSGEYNLKELGRPRSYTDAKFLELRKEISDKMKLVTDA